MAFFDHVFFLVAFRIEGKESEMNISMEESASW